MKVSDLKDKATVDEITLTIVEVQEPINTRYGPVQPATAKDDTGDVQLSLWNEQVGQYAAEDKIKITKGWSKTYNGTMQVSTGKFGTIEKTEE
jgi:ssDNA-binding replication factor A large subunit